MLFIVIIDDWGSLRLQSEDNLLAALLLHCFQRKSDARDVATSYTAPHLSEPLSVPGFGTIVDFEGAGAFVTDEG